MAATKKRRKGHPLRRLQFAAQHDIDRAFAPLADAAERIVLDRCPPDAKGKRRVTPFAKAMVLLDLGTMLAAAEPGVALAIHGRIVEAEALGGNE